MSFVISFVLPSKMQSNPFRINNAYANYNGVDVDRVILFFLSLFSCVCPFFSTECAQCALCIYMYSVFLDVVLFVYRHYEIHNRNILRIFVCELFGDIWLWID